MQLVFWPARQLPDILSTAKELHSSGIDCEAHLFSAIPSPGPSLVSISNLSS